MINCSAILIQLRFVGLFHKAIAQSGVVTNPWSFEDSTDRKTMLSFKLIEKLGKTTSDPEVAYEFLKTIDAKKLIETEQKSLLSEIVSLNILFQLHNCTRAICYIGNIVINYMCTLKEYYKEYFYY